MEATVQKEEEKKTRRDKQSKYRKDRRRKKQEEINKASIGKIEGEKEEIIEVSSTMKYWLSNLLSTLLLSNHPHLLLLLMLFQIRIMLY